MKTYRSTACLAATAMVAMFTSQTSSAGEIPVAAAPPEATNSGDWCEWLQGSAGNLYKNSDNPWLQSFHLGGRFHYQAAYLDGEDVNGRDFNDTYDDYRRARIETKVQFLRYLTLVAGVNMVSDGRRNGNDLDWGYQNFDEAYLTFDAGKAFGITTLDSLKVGYGRMKYKISEEVYTSSKNIITVERSGLGNYIYRGGRPTEFLVSGTKGPWGLAFGVMSTEDDTEFIGGWNDGITWNMDTTYKASEDLRFRAGVVYNDVERGEDDFVGYEWVAAFDTIYEKDRFGILWGLVYGGNHDWVPNRSGNFYGTVVMPWYWLVEKKLQAVAQYSYAGADESEGVRIATRYGRSQHSPGVDVNGGRGDSLHQFYLGLNYYLCDHNAKIMGGVEYQTMDTPKGDFDTLTWLIAFRTYF